MGKRIQDTSVFTATPSDLPFSNSVGKKRWLVASAFALVLCANQALVSFLIPLQSQLQRVYGIDELSASLSILVIPIICVLLSVPCGRLIDRIGFRPGSLLGCGVMALALPFRFDAESFAGLMAGQVLIGISQPLLLNGISKMAVEWFDESARGKAIGISTAGMFFGLAMGLGLPPLLAEEYGVQGALFYFSVLSLLPSVLLWMVSRNAPAAPGLGALAPIRLALLVRMPGMIPVLLATVVGCGLFNALALCLEPVLLEQGQDAQTLAAAGVMMILAGVFGALFIAQLAVLARGKIIVLALCGIGALINIWPLFQAASTLTTLVHASLLGMFLLPGYALLIAMSEEAAGKEQAAQANALVTLAGNIGAATGMGAVTLIHAMFGSWSYVVAFLIAMAAGQTLIVTLFKSLRRL